MLKTFEKMFVMAMLAYACGAFEWLFGPPHQIELGSTRNIGSFAVQIGLHVVALLFYILHAKKLTRAIIRVPWLIMLVFFAILSAAWSQDPELTLRRGVLLAGTIVFGVYFGTRFELKEQLHILAWTLLIILVASTAVAILIPRYGVETGEHFGSWRGLLVQKNLLARVAVLATLVFSAWRPSLRPLRYFALGLAITVLAMTRSATGLIVFIAFVCGVPLVRLVRTRPKLWVSVVIVLLAAGATVGTVLVNNSALVLALLGRSSTLTGRIDIWRAALVPIMNRPFLGYGFDAFWLGAKGESGLIDRTVHYLVPHAHNGALELLLNLGAIGLALFVVAYTLYVGKSLRFYLRQHNYLRVWPLAYMAFMFLYNVTEVTDISGNNIFAMLFAAVAITVTLRTPEMETDENEYAPTCDYKSELVYLS